MKKLHIIIIIFFAVLGGTIYVINKQNSTAKPIQTQKTSSIDFATASEDSIYTEAQEHAESNNIDIGETTPSSSISESANLSTKSKLKEAQAEVKAIDQNLGSLNIY